MGGRFGFRRGSIQSNGFAGGFGMAATLTSSGLFGSFRRFPQPLLLVDREDSDHDLRTIGEHVASLIPDAIIEPYLDPETTRIGEKIKPWGMLGVIVILIYVDKANAYFFRFVYWLCETVGANRALAEIGHAAFKFWAKPPV